jgi:hypothetical protein
VSLPIALGDMHNCEEFNVKRRRNTEDKCRGIPEKLKERKRLLTIEKKSIEIPTNFKDQPRSPFCFFMYFCLGFILILLFIFHILVHVYTYYFGLVVSFLIFYIFREEFSQNFEDQTLIEVSQKGFETWTNMSFEVILYSISSYYPSALYLQTLI